MIDLIFKNQKNIKFKHKKWEAQALRNVYKWTKEKMGQFALIFLFC